jgi:hypothetical protein
MLKMFDQSLTFDYLLFDQKIPNMVDFWRGTRPDHRKCVRVGLVGMNPNPNNSPISNVQYHVEQFYTVRAARGRNQQFFLPGVVTLGSSTPGLGTLPVPRPLNLRFVETIV